MSSFNFIESFFMLSLGITFVLIVLLVYHFKQRLATMEKKCDTMFDIVQNLVKEMSIVKGTCMMCPQSYLLSPSMDVREVHLDEDDEQDEEEYESDEEEEQEQDSDESEEEPESESEDESDEPKVIDLSEPLPEDIVIHKITDIDYKKLTVAELKARAIEKGLATPPIKMNKTELLKLFVGEQ